MHHSVLLELFLGSNFPGNISFFVDIFSTAGELQLETADTLQMKGSCYCTLGRAHHASGDFDQAQSCYAKANRLNAKLPLSHFGLAQMLIRQGETKNAATELDTVLDMRPKEIDALMLMGRLSPHMPTKAEKAVPRFREAAWKHTNDAAVQVRLPTSDFVSAEMSVTSPSKLSIFIVHKKCLYDQRIPMLSNLIVTTQ